MYSSISSLLYRSICIIFNFGKSVMKDSFYSMYVTWRVVVELDIGDQVFVFSLALPVSYTHLTLPTKRIV